MTASPRPKVSDEPMLRLPQVARLPAAWVFDTTRPRPTITTVTTGDAVGWVQLAVLGARHRRAEAVLNDLRRFTHAWPAELYAVAKLPPAAPVPGVAEMVLAMALLRQGSPIRIGNRQPGNVSEVWSWAGIWRRTGRRERFTPWRGP